jgi:adenylate cyclase
MPGVFFRGKRHRSIRDAAVPRYWKAIAFGLIIGLLGVVASLLPVVEELDQRLGLGLLFNLRGPRTAPPEAVIVSMDRESAQRLDIQRDPVKWPRAAHAELLDVLKTGGAKFVAFDILFDEHRDPLDDEKFAAAIRKAGNVILCGCTLSEHILLHGNERKVEGSVMIETFLPPIPSLATPALATASFPLPRLPARVDQCWSFKLGNTPPPWRPHRFRCPGCPRGLTNAGPSSWVIPPRFPPWRCSSTGSTSTTSSSGLLRRAT